MCVQNLKFVALPIPGIIGYPKNSYRPSCLSHYLLSHHLGRPWKRSHSFFSEIFMGFCSDGPCECTSHICILATSLNICYGEIGVMDFSHIWIFRA